MTPTLPPPPCAGQIGTAGTRASSIGPRTGPRLAGNRDACRASPVPVVRIPGAGHLHRERHAAGDTLDGVGHLPHLPRAGGHRILDGQFPGLSRAAAALRHEARVERPAFSPMLHERVVARIAPQAPRTVRKASRLWTWGAAGVVAAGACAAIVMAPRRTSPVDPAPAPDAAIAAQGIDVLPTPEDIRAGVLNEVLALAATGVADLPALSELAALAPADFPAADGMAR